MAKQAQLVTDERLADLKREKAKLEQIAGWLPRLEACGTNCDGWRASINQLHSEISTYIKELGGD